MPWVRKINMEYKKVRPFMSCDFYPHTLSPLDNSNWCISQYNRPENGDGMILAFRRPLSVCPQAEINLGGIDKDKTYIFTSEDTNEVVEISGETLTAEPYILSLPQKRTSLLIFYKVK
ncbi:hypothetical protein SDC9_126321 [bioreactor metagenome]|uniref:Glycosyl hydrolase family 36 C-terminal domain-containing protein n=1 Tax=bioreactor metagenome TaxID=1076179 RepID=A0A645CQW0_9ZZZZ